VQLRTCALNPGSKYPALQPIHSAHLAVIANRYDFLSEATHLSMGFVITWFIKLTHKIFKNPFYQNYRENGKKKVYFKKILCRV
jgi:hypothetical protein